MEQPQNIQPGQERNLATRSVDTRTRIPSGRSGLLQFEIEITGRCNLKCDHCYVGDDPADMDPDLAHRLLAEAADLDCPDVILTGGEPLLASPLLFSLAECAQSFHYRLGLLSNGLLMREEHLPGLRLFDYIQLSLDTPPGVGGKRVDCSAQVIETARMLKAAGIRVAFLCTVDRQNLQYVGHLARLAADLDIQISFNRFVPVGRGAALTDRAFTVQEMRDVTELLNRMKHEEGSRVAFNCPLTVLVDSAKREKSRQATKPIIGGCIAGVAACIVTMTGDVYPCPFLRVAAGNVTGRSLAEVWSGSALFKLLRDRTNLKGACRDCTYRNICGGCRACAYALTGDPFASDPQCFIGLTDEAVARASVREGT